MLIAVVIYAFEHLDIGDWQSHFPTRVLPTEKCRFGLVFAILQPAKTPQIIPSTLFHAADFPHGSPSSIGFGLATMVGRLSACWLLAC
jgi:hypothetical protein